jgi:hypothetical protein
MILAIAISLVANDLIAQNPIITDQYSADPTARVFENRVYVYPSHDIPPSPGKGRPNWFLMEDYHVFSSDNLVDWQDHGMIVHQNKVPWVKPESYSMWAPDCIYRNGKYYFYFPSVPSDTTGGRGFRIGVAISDKPSGPFIPQPTAIKGVNGIDPNVFIDKDGQAYLYWSQGHIYGAKLKENMLELASDPVILQELPTKGLKEGPFLFERNGIYYMTYPHVENKTERLEYAIGSSPLGPFKFTGVIMDESPDGCWTNHHSLLHFKDQWYLFYHHNDLSPQFDKNRSVRIDSLFFEPDGKIRKVLPTLRGVGVSNAFKKIQIDRYSMISERGVSALFLDTTDRFKGWKAQFSSPGAWLQYTHVDFGKSTPKKVIVKLSSKRGGTLQLRTGSRSGPLMSEIVVPKDTSWKMVQSEVKLPQTGLKHLFVSLKGEGDVGVDWLQFE